MRIAIIGAGFGGLSAAISLIDKGHKVVVFEASEKPGGLADGIKEKKWEWSLEKFYHHIFEGDKYIRELADKVGSKVVFYSPVTSVYCQGKISRMDSPLSLLSSPLLSFVEKIWMAGGLVVLKLIPDGLAMYLERFRASRVLPFLLSPGGYKKIWERLLKSKFSTFYKDVNLAWFWARISKRSQKLGYFDRGFEGLAFDCLDYIEERGGEVRLSNKVEKVVSKARGIYVDGEKFDYLISTIPAPLVKKIMKVDFVEPKIDYLWAQTLVLRFKKSILPCYWLNILDEDLPFLVAVEHTKMIDSKNYNKETIVYLGNYLKEGDERLNMSDKKLIELFMSGLVKINPKIKRNEIIGWKRFKAPYAQPVFPIDYSKQIPELKVSGKRIIVATMSHVYPFDRGTNYAVALGLKAASLIQ